MLRLDPHSVILLLALAVSACAQRTADSPEARTPDKAAARPPGVSVDPPFALPAAQAEAQASDQLTALEAPPSAARARHLVKEFFTAVVDEDEAALLAMIGADAVFLNPENDRRLPARGFWLSRFSRFDYTTFAGRTLYQAPTIETFDHRAARALKRARRLPLDVNSNQILVRVALTESALERPLRFGPSLTFLVGVHSGQWTIDAVAEDFKAN